jgi:hypothetical protein
MEFLILNVITQIPINSIDELLQPHDHSLDARLIGCVVILGAR